MRYVPSSSTVWGAEMKFHRWVRSAAADKEAGARPRSEGGARFHRKGESRSSRFIPMGEADH
jgi:hypothetical protein